MRRTTIVAAAAAISVLTLSSCDPEKEALKVFTDQGLTLLRPARDYVVAGGIIIWPKGGKPVYVDPFFKLSALDAEHFNGVIYEAANSKTVQFGIVLGLLHKMLPFDIGLKAGSANETKLDQIDAPGKRMTVPMMNAALKDNATRDFIHEQLTSGASAFLVQEVYSAKSLNLSATTGGNFNLSVDGKAAEDCAKKDTSKVPAAGDTPAAETKPSGGDKPKDSAPDTPPAVTKPAATPKKDDPAPAAAAATPAKDSGGIGICVNNGTTIKFTSTNPLPILVRLTKVIVTPKATDKSLKLQLGAFKFPNSLGDSAREQYTFVDADSPAIDGLTRYKKK